MTPFAYKLPIRALWLGLLSLLLVGCQIDSEPKSELEKIRERGVLRVGTLNNPLSYYIGPDGPTGLDYELAREFAKELGVKLEMKPAYRLSSLFPALKTVKWTSLPQLKPIRRATQRFSRRSCLLLRIAASGL